MQWRVEIGMFFRKSKDSYRDRILLPIIRLLFSCCSRFRFVFVMLILFACGDIKSNPGPKILYKRQRKFVSINYTSSNAFKLDISNAISSSKRKYHEHLANKHNDLKTTPKTY